MADRRGPGRPLSARQQIRVESGIGYGAIGADIHVFGDGVPLYLLENWRTPPAPDPQWLRELPSRMLNARYAVVDFTGRQRELAQLHEWRRTGPRLAMRWLYGPGGTGKTRLAQRFAAGAFADGWKVVNAIRGPGTLLPMLDSQDMTLGDARGLLLIVDYADHWPLTHLSLLVSNQLFQHSEMKTRMLLVARTADAWQRARLQLANDSPAATSHLLEQLPDGSAQREQMFTAARDGYGRQYGLPDVSGITPPARLDHPDLALTLAVHVAALVAVDAHVGNRDAPSDMAGLTIYLLDRERSHWDYLFGGDDAHELNPEERVFRTPPATMNRVVFAAALTGPVARDAGAAVLDSLEVKPDPARALADHAFCYPSAEPSGGLVLEPLYPDRLAEDFLALTIPGHHSDYPRMDWAPRSADALLARSGPDQAAAAWTQRAIIFLAAATERWPHVGADYLYPLVQSDPRLAVEAGSAALSSLARLAEAPISLFEAIEPHLPEERDVDLDTGSAAVIGRLAADRLAATRDQGRRTGIFLVLARYQLRAGLRQEALRSALAALEASQTLTESGNPSDQRLAATTLAQLSTYFAEVGRREEALDAAMRAARSWKRLADADPGHSGLDLASALQDLGAALAEAGRPMDALAAGQKALEIWRRLATSEPSTYERWLAGSLINVGAGLATAGRWTQAAEHSAEALEIYRRLAAAAPATFEPDVALALNNLSGHLAETGELARSSAAAEEAVRIRRRLAKANPAAFEAELASSLTKLANSWSDAECPDEALAAEEEAVEVRRRLAAAIPAAFEADLALSLHNVSSYLSELGRGEEALAAAEESGRIWRRLALGDPDAFEQRLAQSLSGVASAFADLGRYAEALAAAEESVTILRKLAGAAPAVHTATLAMVLANLGGYLSRQGRPDQGLAVTEEAVAAYRALAAADPGVHDRVLAIALGKLGLRHSGLGQHAEAVSALRDAAAIYRRLAAQNPWEADLGRALADLAGSRTRQGRAAEAVALAEEAISVLTALAAASPDAHRGDLAHARAVLAKARIRAARQKG